MEGLAHIYFSQTRKEIVVASTSVNDAGIYYEQDSGASVLPLACGAEMLGGAIALALARFSHADRNLRNVKKSTWPAFLASSAKSARAFENGTILVSASLAGDIVQLSGSTYASQSDARETSVPASGASKQLGEAAFKLFAVVSGQHAA